MDHAATHESLPSSGPIVRPGAWKGSQWELSIAHFAVESPVCAVVEKLTSDLHTLYVHSVVFVVVHVGAELLTL